eukprot:CAMPEP_0181035268 /NCGR_PEP_ID=MMETSP1070-20121207/8235_1 /TAXON_ID=265543 /ORGANISM="Minutocellus polymorphus, Strain NH13" /LENGTH=221 /DNA_ID=CAMNT_0023112821 /DNA_START=133 /DNA_END=798 /DNA_ORIENTATION=+
MAVVTRSTPKKSSPKSSDMSRKERHVAERKERGEAFAKKLSILETFSKNNAAASKKNAAGIKKNAAGIKKNAKRVDEIAERVNETTERVNETTERVIEVEAVTEEITERVDKAEASVNRLQTGQRLFYEALTGMKRYSSLIAEAVIDLNGRSESPPLPPIVKVCRLVLFICFVCGCVSFFYKPDGMPLWLHTLFIILCEAAAFFVILLVLGTYETLSKKNE